jgi:pimeloyl-ACP methyl ester carboxylesterase
MTFRRSLAVALAAALAAAIVNAWLVQREARPARADAGRVLRLPGPDLHVREDGVRGRAPLVLLHCYTCSLEWWDAVVPALARRHRVIRLDLVGHGGSEKPRSGYAMADQARQVGRALAVLGVKRAVFVGQSMGVSVATAVAERHPTLVRRLIAIDEAPGDNWEHAIGLTAKLGFVPGLGEAIYRLVPDSMVRGGLEIAFAEGHPVPDFAVESFRDVTYNAYRDSGLESDDYKDERPIHERLAALGVPVAAIFGRDDRIADVPKSVAAYREIPGAEVATVAAAGHSPNVERPALTARLILRHAASQDRRPRRDRAL